MTEPSALPLPLAEAGIPDPDNPDFLFETSEWNEDIQFNDEVSLARTEARRYHFSQFKTITNPTSWNRYVHLGLYAYDDGLEFDCTWDDPETTWYKRHKIVWYNYVYHTQHNLVVPPKLQVWANTISLPFILKKDPEFLNFDTRKVSWRDLYYVSDDDHMDVDISSN